MQNSQCSVQNGKGEEKGHPRLFFTAAELERLKKQRGFHEQILKNIRESADWCLEGPVRREWIAPVTPDPVYGNLYDRFYAMMHDMAVMEHLAFAYAYTEDVRYLKGARDWSLACSRVWSKEAKGEPDAGKAYAVMRLIKGLAVSYDLLYHRLPESELREIRDALVLIGGKYYQWYLENPGMAGPGQDKHHGSAEAASFGLVALALLEEIPEARLWLDLMVQKHTEYLLTHALTAGGTQEQTSNFWASTLQYRILFLDPLRRVTGRDLFKEFPDCLPGRIALAAVAGKHRPGWDLAGRSVIFGPSYGQLNYWSPVLIFLAREHQRPIYQYLAMWDETLGSIHKTRYFSPQNEQLLFAWGPYAYAWYDPSVKPGIEPDLLLSFKFRDPIPGQENSKKGWITKDVNEVYMRSSYAPDAIVAGMRRCFTEIHAGGRVVVLTPWDRLNAEVCQLDELNVTEYNDHAAIECKGEEDSGFERQTIELYRPDRLRFYRRTNQDMVWWCHEAPVRNGETLSWPEGTTLTVQKGTIISCDPQGYADEILVGMGKLKLFDPLDKKFPLIKVCPAEDEIIFEIRTRIGSLR